MHFGIRAYHAIVRGAFLTFSVAICVQLGMSGRVGSYPAPCSINGHRHGPSTI